MHSRPRAALERALEGYCKHSGAPQETPPVQAGNKIVSNRKPPLLANEKAKRKNLA
jgi:hypothetical protein